MQAIQKNVDKPTTLEMLAQQIFLPPLSLVFEYT